MIYITTAANDKDLVTHFGDRGITAPIPYGDMIFRGVWTGGDSISPLVERKHMLDLITCINDHRHLEQIRSAREAGFFPIFLIIEDRFRKAEDGTIQVKSKRRYQDTGFEYSRLEAYILELNIYAGVQTFWTHNVKETVDQVMKIYEMLQVPPEDHSSITGFFQPPHPVALNSRPSLKRRIFAELHGIGWLLSARAEEYFRDYSIVESLAAGKIWEGIDMVGPKTAEMIHYDCVEDR